MIFFYTVYSSQGSIITETQLVFNSTAQIPTVQEVLDTLLSAVLKGGADPLKILPASISVNGSGKFPF